MAKTKEQKKEMIEGLKKDLSEMKSLVIIDYYGLKVNETQELRKILKKNNCRYLVAKKTLLDIALKEVGFNNIDLSDIKGGIGLVFGLDSDILPAKMTVDFAKDHKELEIQGGIFEKNLISEDKVKTLASLPTKPEIISQLLRTIKGPISGFVYSLKGNLNNLVYVLSAIKEKK